ncbi:MAG: putative Vacuolar protein-sorting-associated protein 36, partial [Streblomastix strix]
MGIVSPVTKEQSGTDYEAKLAKEIASFLKPVLEGTGGIMMMVDAYARTNRARGMNRISPEDMVKACSLFISLNLGLEVSNTQTGVSIINLPTHSESAMCQRILKIVQAKGIDEQARIIEAQYSGQALQGKI